MVFLVFFFLLTWYLFIFFNPTKTRETRKERRTQNNKIRQLHKNAKFTWLTVKVYIQNLQEISLFGERYKRITITKQEQTAQPLKPQ